MRHVDSIMVCSWHAPAYPHSVRGHMQYCGEYLNITRAMFEEAKRRVLNLDFLGMTDAFNASVCLFHHQFGGKPQEWSFQSVGGLRSGIHLFDNHGTGKVEKFPGAGARVHPSTW